MNEEMVPISEAKVRLHELVRGLAQREVILLRRGRPVAVMLSFGSYRALLDGVDDLEDRLAIFKAREELPDSRILWSGLKEAADLH